MVKRKSMVCKTIYTFKTKRSGYKKRRTSRVKRLGKSSVKYLRKAAKVVMVAAEIAGTTKKMLKGVFNITKGKKKMGTFYKERLQALIKKLKN